ncbi:MAG: tRNA epoxyqueuosine(34) reductase QueG [Microcystis sp. M113S1]|uniref:tRNA epoxyqueuosine(34) reductase QueG n=1 Tax=Microcystis sp. M113S1 TaxID=2771104 RepID=UPI00258E69A8|nr:tRNA epoxyqueuosine(34) reductase QueG [Microcystis sp. M113S1]MCA2938205.1 tRNA epoxyqueuosine(34) reductase QueG [Microcystis sp. M113S1]
MVTETQIKEKALELGFHEVGIASVDSQDSAVSHLKSWLERGYNADMDWMTNPKRQDIKTLWPEVRSLIGLALNYYTPQQHSQEQNHGKISRYAWGRDYHKVLSKKLKALSQWLESQGEQIQTRYYVDTGPVQDKVWAQRAGIGWIAKNGNLITRNYGSWVFLAEILTNLPLEPDQPHSDHCGTCSRCLSACPTQAIVSPYVVDANRCIAYHTIENRAVTLPTEIAKNLQGWVAGCDICQDVCPWNQRFAQVTDVEDFQPRPENLSPRLDELANLTIEEWDRRFISSALRRIKPQQWRRNAQANLAHSPHPVQDDN